MSTATSFNYENIVKRLKLFSVNILHRCIINGDFQSVTKEEATFVSNPTVKELILMKEGINELFNREIWKYENEYKEQLFLCTFI